MNAYPRKYVNTNKAWWYQSFQKQNCSLGKEPNSKSSIQVITNPGMITILIRPIISFVNRDENSVSFLGNIMYFLIRDSVPELLRSKDLAFPCFGWYLSKIHSSPTSKESGHRNFKKNLSNYCHVWRINILIWCNKSFFEGFNWMNKRKMNWMKFETLFNYAGKAHMKQSGNKQTMYSFLMIFFFGSPEVIKCAVWVEPISYLGIIGYWM